MTLHCMLWKTLTYQNNYSICIQEAISQVATIITVTEHQGSQIRQIWRILRQNCSDDSTEVTEGVTSTPEIFGNKQGATSTPEICGNKHSFVLTFFTSNTIHVNCKRCKP